MSISGFTKSTHKPAPISAKPSLSWNAETGKLTINFQGRAIFSAPIRVVDASGTEVVGAAPNVSWEERSRPAQSVYLGYDHGPEYAGDVPEDLQAHSWEIKVSPPQPDQQIIFNGRLQSTDPLACHLDGTPGIIRGSVGKSASKLNNAVYDRSGDWALAFAEPQPGTIRFIRSTTLATEFAVEASAPQVKLVFRPDYYRVHRGYFFWNPAKKTWREPISGWCSWAAYGQSVTEEQVLRAADFFAKELLPYGYNIIQIDDGYQIYNQNDPKPLEPGESVADYWVNPNERFPSGMGELAKRIKAKHLTPGIWLSTSLPLGLRKEWYVLGDDDKPFRGPWVNYAVNGCLEPAVEHGFRRTIRGLRMQGWRYFKIDTIRHILYDNYRQVPDYWRKRGEDSELAFRSIFQSIAEEIGPSIYMLACWGVIPELCDIADGCRIGGDVGADWDSILMVQKYACQFNYLNNIVWRNDPDYMCFRVPLQQARTWATMIALTGMQLMVSDPPEAYDEERLDILRKIGPPLFVRPATLAPVEQNAEFWLLELNNQPEPYTVLGQIAWSDNGLAEKNISFAQLGLNSDERFLVFDFWNEEFIGEFEGEFPSANIDAGDCRVYSIRPSLDRPQVLSTNRHISQGAYELEKVAWRDHILTGCMKLPPGRPFNLYIYVPKNYDVVGTTSTTSALLQDKQVLKMTLSSEQGGMVDWSVRFQSAGE